MTHILLFGNQLVPDKIEIWLLSLGGLGGFVITDLVMFLMLNGWLSRLSTARGLDTRFSLVGQGLQVFYVHLKAPVS